MSTVDINQLRLLAIFATVVESGSFAAASRKLNTSRSRVSEQISILETALEIRLLQRSTRALNITNEGRLVYEQAKKLRGILTDLESNLYSSKPKGRVSITMPHHIAHLFMPEVLQAFRGLYPEIELDLILDDHRLNLISDEVDLAIRVGVPKDESIIARIMHEEKVSLFASPEYLEKFGEITSLESLTKCRWVLLGKPSNNPTQHLFNTHGEVSIEPRYYSFCNSPFMIRNMLLKGLGVGKLLPSIASQEIKSGRLVSVMPSLTGQTVSFSLIYPSRMQIPLRIRTTIDYLLDKNIFHSGLQQDN